MLTVRIIPCLDVSNGRVVKGVRFSNLRDAGSPTELARLYEEQGADELVFLDVSATTEGRRTHIETIRLLRQELSIPLTTGGGVKAVEDVAALLAAGADKVSINSAAVQKPELINEIASQFGSQCTILALDAAQNGLNSWEVVTHSGKTKTGIDAISWVKEATDRGAGEILLTSWDRDGTRSGYDLELITRISQVVTVPVIASGGANNPEHLLEALDAGANAVLAASIFHEGDYTVSQVKDFLQSMGVKIRK